MKQYIQLDEVKHILSHIIRTEAFSIRERLSAIDRMGKIEKWYSEKSLTTAYEKLEKEFEETLNVDKLEHSNTFNQ